MSITFTFLIDNFIWEGTLDSKLAYQNREINLTLMWKSLSSVLQDLTPIVTKILTSDPYESWPLLPRMSVLQTLELKVPRLSYCARRRTLVWRWLNCFWDMPQRHRWVRHRSDRRTWGLNRRLTCHQLWTRYIQWHHWFWNHNFSLERGTFSIFICD